MGKPSQHRPERQPPLVLRKVPPERQQLARSMTARGADPQGGIWWELVDAAAPPELPAVAVALTDDGAGGCVTVSALGVRMPMRRRSMRSCSAGSWPPFEGTPSDAVVIHAADRVVASALVEVGFRHAPDSNGGDRYLIVL